MVAHAQAAAAHDTAERPQSPVALWRHIFGEGHGFLCLFSGRRPAPGDKRLLEVAETYWPYPQSLAFAEQEAYQQDALGREVYFCAHLLTRKRRRKEAAAPVWSLWVDGDGARPHDLTPLPSAEIVSSPGRRQFFWRLAEPIDPGRAEALNRRIAYGIGADRSGWDLTQLVRVPGCHNRKYPDAPEVTIGALDETWVWPADDIDGMAPPLPVALAAIEPPPPPEADDIDDTEPPVRLGADGLAWWRGERVARKEDGAIDRSRTLWGIACALWEAGASRGTVVAALTERDGALGHGCFTDRPEEYARIAGKLVEAPPAPTPATGDCETCTKLRELLASERRQKEEVIALNRAMRKVLGNEGMKQEGRAALGLAFDLWERRDRPDTERKLNRADGENFYRYFPEDAGKKVAMSPDAMSKAKSRLESWGLLKSTAPAVCHTDPETKEEHWTRESYLHIDAPTIPAWLETIGEFKPDEEECRRARKKPWGGRRWQCIAHPEAVVEYTTVARCTTCGTCSEPMVEYADGDGNVADRPEDWPENGGSIGKPQDAATEGNEDDTLGTNGSFGTTVTDAVMVPPDCGGGAMGWMDTAEWARLMRALEERDGKTCHYCLVELVVIPLGATLDRRAAAFMEPRQRTIDHRVPTSRGGTDDLENLVLSCRRCNSRKGTRSYEDFMASVVPGLRAGGPLPPVPADVLEEVERGAAEWREAETARLSSYRVGGEVRHPFMGSLPIVGVVRTRHSAELTLRLPNGDERTFYEGDIRRGLWRAIERAPTLVVE